MNYENICLLYINYENMKMFVCKTWIMKIGKYLQYMSYEKWKCLFAILQIMKTGNYLFAKHELKNRKMFTIHYENICLQYMNYETFVCNTLWK